MQERRKEPSGVRLRGAERGGNQRETAMVKVASCACSARPSALPIASSVRSPNRRHGSAPPPPLRVIHLIFVFAFFFLRRNRRNRGE